MAEAEIKKQQAQEIAETKRREAVAEAKAGADIVSAQQARRAKEAQLEAERAISDRQRELEQTIRSNAALIAEAEAKKQDALAVPARGGTARHADRPGDGRRRAHPHRGAGEGARRRRSASRRWREANAESIRKVNEAIQAGGESYFRYRQVEMLPQIVPAIADALAQAKLVTISSGADANGAAGAATENITRRDPHRAGGAVGLAQRRDRQRRRHDGAAAKAAPSELPMTR